MRILMISDVYFPRINGVSTSIQTFRQQLQQLNHEVLIVAPDYGQKSDESDIMRIPSRYLIVDPEDRMMKFREITRLIPVLEKYRFDIIHIHTPFIAHYAGLKIARALALPVIETYHTLFEEYLYHYIRFLPRRLLRFAARQFTKSQCNSVDAVVVPSRPMLDTLLDYGVEARTAIIPTGLQMEKFERGDGDAFRNQHKIPKERPTLVHVGRIAYEKNIDFLLHMLAQVKTTIPNVLMVIAGEGPALKHLQELAKKLSLQENILFVGYLSRDHELMDCYKAGNIFVFSSRTETQGLVLLEAMALGVPVVSTAIMGTKDILDSGKGALVAEDDLSDFSNKVIQLLQNPTLLKQLSEEARAYAQTWSAAALAEKMQNLYVDVLNQQTATFPEILPDTKQPD